MTVDEPIIPTTRAPRLTRKRHESWIRVADDSGQIQTEVPVSWSNVWGNGWHVTGFPPYEGRIGPGLNAGPDLGRWWDDPHAPGIFIGTTTRMLDRYSITSVAHRLRFDGCTVIAAGDITFAGYRGRYVEWEGETPLHNWICVAATPDTNDYLLFIQAKIVNGEDFQAVDHAFQSLRVTGAQ